MASEATGAVARPSQEDIDALVQLNAEQRYAECLERVEALLESYPQAPRLCAIAAAASRGLGRIAKAIGYFDRLVELQPGNAIAYVDRANCLSDVGRLQKAVADFERAIELQPGNAAAHGNCASVLYQMRRLGRALERADAAIALRPNWYHPHFTRANALKDMGRDAEALASYDRAIELFPEYSLAWCNRGLVLQELGRPEEALASFTRAIEINPHLYHAYTNRGQHYLRTGRLALALADCDEVVRLRPGSAESYFDRGNVFQAMQRNAEALAAHSKAIELDPGHFKAHNNRGLVLVPMHRLEEALESYDRALEINADYASALSNRGFLLYTLNRPEEAVVSLDRALEIDPNLAGAYHNRAVVLARLGRREEATADFDKAIELKPGESPVISQMLYHRAQICDWTVPPSNFDLAKLGIEGEPFSPLVMLSIEDEPERHLARARKWSDKIAFGKVRPAFSPSAPGGKIRLGYFSADYNNHAVAHLISRLFEVHDKDKFEVRAYGFGTDPWDSYRQRVADAVDHFHDVAKMSDEDVAALARSHELDIAIDLTGYTQDERPGIFAHGAAPLQINYLGYPGTMGADFIDYIIADPVLIPESHRHYYSEKIVYLPGSYQANDDQRAISDKTFTRAELGLPEEAFVFCCFNANFKITPAEFDVWARLLREVEGSVLWLLGGNDLSQANLTREAEARGMDLSRLVFAPRMPMADHLARHRNADLFLDTFCYNAHTTGSDALWSGLPFVTRIGESFASRVGASLLKAVGLDELITQCNEEYESLILHLARNPEELAGHRQRLAENLAKGAVLFDSPQFARHIENAYEQVLERYREGLPPEHVVVPGGAARGRRKAKRTQKA